MKSEFLIDALELLDDALLIEADAKRVNRRKIIVLRTVWTAAACVVLIVVAMLLFGAPYKRDYHLLAGKDWRFLREGGIDFSTERPDPQYIVKETKEPEVVVTNGPTRSPSSVRATKAPANVNNNETARPSGNGNNVETARPSGSDPNVETPKPSGDKKPVGTTKPSDSETNVETPKPSGDKKPVETTKPSGNEPNVETARPSEDDNTVTTEVPAPTENAVETKAPVKTASPEKDEEDVVTMSPSPSADTEDDEWIYYIAENTTETGEYYGVEQQFVMQLLASALNVEYVEPTEVPTLWPTEVPTMNPEPESPIPTMNPEPEPPTSTMTPGEPEETRAPDDPEDPGDSDSEQVSKWNYTLLMAEKSYAWQKRSIPISCVGAYKSKGVMVGTSNSGENKSTNVSVYKIKGASTDAVAAVHVDSQNGYYLFANSNYSPSTFKEFVKDYNLKDYLEWDALAVYGKYTLKNEISSKVWAALNNADGNRVDAKSVFLNGTLAAAVAMDIDVYGYEDIPMAVYKEGYVMFSLFGQVYAFDIGENEVNQIMECQ